MALEAAVHAAARQLRVEAAPHRLDDVVERQDEAAAQLDDLIGVARRCGRVERSATSGRAFQRATVRGWIPSSRASAACEAVLCWI